MNLLPVDYLEFLVAARQPLFLVSAYDVARATTACRERKAGLLSRAVAANQVVLMDSGNYEAFWKADGAWDAAACHRVVDSVFHQLCFCHD